MGDEREKGRHSPLDENALLDYLRGNTDFESDSIAVTRCIGGNSNLTFLVELDSVSVILRTPPTVRSPRSANDMSREHVVLSAIAPHFPLAPKPILHCTDENVIGTDFLLLERIDGPIIRENIPSDLASSSEKRNQLLDAFMKNLADLHSIDFKEIGLGHLWKGEGYVKRQVQVWTERFAEIKTETIQDMDEVAVWLVQNAPEDSGCSLIHNDYKLDNVVLDPFDSSRPIGILDWEMATIGDPLMDLGATLAYWIPAESADRLGTLPFNPRGLMDEFHRDALIEKYIEHSGRDVDHIDFYHVTGLFKVAIFAQMIYLRDLSQPEERRRFTHFPDLIRELGRLAMDIIHEKG